MTTDYKQAALDYHAEPTPGKIGIALTKPADTRDDLALAYSPGVAEPVREIVRDPNLVYRYTAKGHLVAVITNGTAVLGLGNVGALASKPVMEGKALLFKRFANIDAVDIEVDTDDSEQFIETVERIADTFGGINLEDIKSPECFYIEQALIERCNVPVFHDDQHGTAIVIAAGLLNALEIQGKSLADTRVVCLGAGAAGIVCMRLLVILGLPRDHITMIDRKGVIYAGRSDLNAFKKEFARETSLRTMSEALEGADVFLGLSGPNLLQADKLKRMADKPIVFACSNPDPEIDPVLAKQARSDILMATGRSDQPNQVNNVLAFPFIFRGALDVRATQINEAMKVAAVHALRALAKQPVPEEVLQACDVDALSFGRDYIIPMPMDSRLLSWVAPAVAQAAIDSGVAQQPYPAEYPKARSY